MITKTKFNLYLTYLFFSAIWLGAAFHDSFATNYTWYVDPLTYIKYTTEHSIPGALSAWPFSTLLLLIFSLTAFIMLRKYTGPAKKDMMTSISGTLLLIVATGLYFVPTLRKIFGETEQYSNASLIEMSRTWVVLNIIRFVMLVFLFIFGLRGLAKINKI